MQITSYSLYTDHISASYLKKDAVAIDINYVDTSMMTSAISNAGIKSCTHTGYISGTIKDSCFRRKTGIVPIQSQMYRIIK